MQLVRYLSIQARANRLMNRRLHEAMAALAAEEFHAPRVGFFPSLAATLNHILAVDEYYVGALHGDTGLVQAYRAFVPAATLAELAPRQAACDQRLIAWCDALASDEAADVAIAMERRDHVQHERAAQVLAHLFMHQVHHRGQAHAMLSATAVAPPQLDEFMMPSEAHLRAADMAALGWSEAEVYGAG